MKCRTYEMKSVKYRAPEQTKPKTTFFFKAFLFGTLKLYLPQCASQTFTQPLNVTLSVKYAAYQRRTSSCFMIHYLNTLFKLSLSIYISKESHVNFEI